jgi:hypothetical protein
LHGNAGRELGGRMESVAFDFLIKIAGQAFGTNDKNGCFLLERVKWRQNE